MILTFYGAAKSVTGSKHLLTINNHTRVLFDCGLVQGNYGEEQNKDFLFSPGSVDYLVLSHAHIDHSGLIPLLVKKGFQGKIFCTEPTLKLTEILLKDSVKVHEPPLYNKAEVAKALSLFTVIPYNAPTDIGIGIQLLFHDAGHILGSAVAKVTFEENGKERSVTYTGDLGRYSNRILNAPVANEESEIIICESTYGHKLHQSIESTENLLLKIIKQVCEKQKGKLLIPAFSIGRTQELIYSLNKLAEEGKFAIPVYVDSPLSVYATDIIKSYPACFNQKMQDYIKRDPDPFGFPMMSFIQDHNESQKLVSENEPAIIISSSGMMDAGRIQYYLKECLPDPKNGLLITGYSAPGTLGAKISKGQKVVDVLGDTIKVNLELFFLQEYSAHADYGDLLLFLSHYNKAKLKHLFLVHGEPKTMRKLRRELKKEGFHNIEIPDMRISYEI